MCRTAPQSGRKAEPSSSLGASQSSLGVGVKEAVAARAAPSTVCEAVSADTQQEMLRLMTQPCSHPTPLLHHLCLTRDAYQQGWGWRSCCPIWEEGEQHTCKLSLEFWGSAGTS